ncbi:MAG: hypothetical protein M1160_01180 [Candidatus Marsarchaeota archaeon]|jgi:hypothetical protein|nr:hypothetical protein [Candidatus Marsarchaeota archaeon]MCL5111480.1 hypothetical protein [Candidatus Marsarchaeota archaeon]
MSSLRHANEARDKEFYSKVHEMLRVGTLVKLSELDFVGLPVQAYRESGLFVLELSRKGNGMASYKHTGHYDLFGKELPQRVFVAYELNEKVVDQIAQNLMPPFTALRKGSMVQRLIEAGLSEKWARYIVNEAATANKAEAAKRAEAAQKMIYDKTISDIAIGAEAARRAVRDGIREYCEQKSASMRDRYLARLEEFHSEVDKEKEARRLRR